MGERERSRGGSVLEELESPRRFMHLAMALSSPCSTPLPFASRQRETEGILGVGARGDSS